MRKPYNPRREAAAKMVYYALYVGAELDGLTNLQPRGGCDDPNFPYYLKVSVPPPPLARSAPLPSVLVANRSDVGLARLICAVDRSSSARTAARSPPSPPTSPSASKSICPKDTTKPTSSRRYPSKISPSSSKIDSAETCLSRMLVTC